MDGSEFRWRLLQAASGQADDEALSTVRVELDERFSDVDDGVAGAGGDPRGVDAEPLVEDERPPRICPACKEAIEEPTLPQHISAGCPALQ